MNDVRARPLRLQPGQDLRRAIEQAVAQEGCDAAFVLAGIGSLSQVQLRLAGALDTLSLHEDLEILTLSGSVTPSASHLHASIARAGGQVLGGHVGPGSIVRTTGEILLALLPGWRFTREVDALTGYAELVARKTSG